MSINLHPVLISIDVIKAVAFAVTSWLTGWGASWLAVLLFQPPQQNVHWLQQPAIVAAFAAALTTIIITLANRYFQKSDKKKEEAKEKENNHITFSEKMQELAQNQTQTVYAELEKLHDKELLRLTNHYEKEVGFWKREYSTKSRSEFESRMRAHAVANEADRRNAHIFTCHKLLSDAGVSIPEFKAKSGEELAAEVEAQMGNFKDDLIDRYEKAMRENNG